MTVHILGRLAGALALTFGLAGCIDAAIDIEVVSETNAKATMTQTMGADFYSMVKAGMASSEDSSEGFCQEEGSSLTENGDGGATCVLVTEGAFADLKFDTSSNDTVKFTSAGTGLVRVAFPTADMAGELGATDEAMDAETKQMMEAFFAGHNITLRVSGREIVDSNMTLAEGNKSAETVIPFLDLLNGELDLPDELYAVVKVN